MRKRSEDFSLKELISIFLPKLWLIMIVSLVFGATAAIYSQFIKKDTYTSTTKIHVIKGDSLDFAVSDVQFATSYLETYVEVLTIPDFLEMVIKDFQSTRKDHPDYETKWKNLKPSDISGKISASTVVDILSISVKTGDPELSYGIADSIANVFEEGKILAYPEDVVLTQTVQFAKRNGPNSKNVALYTLIGLFAGAVLSMIAIFLFTFFDVVIHDKKKIEDSFDMPVLGVIPRFVGALPRFVDEDGKVKDEK